MCARAERMKELENDIILFFALLITNTGIFSVFRISGIDVVLCLRMNWCRWKLVDCLARIMMGFGLHVNRHYVIKFNDFFTQITQSSQFCTHFLQKIDQQKIANKIVKTQSTRSHVDTLVRLVSLVLIAAATTTLLNCLPPSLLLLLSAILDWTLLLLCLFLMCDEYFLSNIFPFFIPFVSPLSNSHTRPPQIYQTMEIILPFFLSLCVCFAGWKTNAVIGFEHVFFITLQTIAIISPPSSLFSVNILSSLFLSLCRISDEYRH